MSKVMKAARFDPKAVTIKLEEIPIPEPKADEILVRTISSGLCHSDLMVLDGSTPLVPTETVTIGHEAIGEIVQFGTEVVGFNKGDVIGFLNGYHACWDCTGCKYHYGFCQSGKLKMQGWSMDGFMQEYCIVDYRAAINIPNGMDTRKAAPLFCAGITAYNTVRAPELPEGSWLGVIGCGGLGQMAVRYAKAFKLRVVAVDIDDDILTHAKEGGADHTINTKSTPDFLGQIHQITSGGLDAVAVFTAVKAGFDIAPSMLRTGGKLIVVGCPPTEISFNATEIALNRYSILGANNSATKDRLIECAEFTHQHNIEPPVRVFKIDQIEEMIDMMQSGKLGGNRLVVVY